MNAKKVYNIIIIAFIILMQVSTVLFYWKTESVSSEYEKNETSWSTLEGQASGRMMLSQNSPEIQQVFVNQHENLKEVILFFYHCAEARSGKVFVKIKDRAGNLFYEFSFEPMYMDQETFCLVANPEEGSIFVPNEEYIIEITAEQMVESDYIEVGTTLKPSKPYIFKEMQNGETLFVKLDYSYIDTTVTEKMVKDIILVWLIADSVLVLLYLVMVKRAWRVVLILGVLVAVISGSILVAKRYVEQHKWYNQYSYIAHAMGKIGGKDYTNSREAFDCAYQEGHKVFEVDFAMTADHKIVLKHDWVNEHGLSEFETGVIPTLEEFKKAKIWGKYTTMDIRDLLQLMLDYPDIYIVTDSKSGDFQDVIEQFQQIEEVMQEYSEKEQKSIRKRIVVQIYNDDMYAGIESIAHFENYIYTLYQRGCNDLDELAEFCIKNQIQVVTLPYSWWTQEIQDRLRSYGLEVWIHTLNDQAQINEFIENGVDGFYTDNPLINDSK